MELLAFLFMFIVVAAAILFSFSFNSKANDSATIPLLENCPSGFVPTLVYMEKYGGSGIALDQHSKTICLVKPDNLNHLVVPYHHLRAALVLQDGVPIATVVRNNQEAKNSLEIVIESLGGTPSSTEGQSTQPSSTIGSIDLKIIHQLPEDPIHTINFLNMEAKVGGFIFNDAVQQIQKWQDLLAALIHLADRASNPDQAPNAQQPQPTAVGNS